MQLRRTFFFEVNELFASFAPRDSIDTRANRIQKWKMRKMRKKREIKNIDIVEFFLKKFFKKC